MKTSPQFKIMEPVAAPRRTALALQGLEPSDGRTPSRFRLHNTQRAERGVALVLVLGLLVLVSGLVVGLLMRSTTERTETGAFFESSRTDNLAEQAVSIVQAQIAHASGNEEGWTSQPGMVRAFNQDGTLKHGYKLFSDDDMVLDVVDDRTISGMLDSLAGWGDKPAIFTDLNAPVLLNAAAATPADKEPVYPIIDAQAVDGGIEGFSVDTAVVGKSDLQPVPMPAKWLYVLKDGTTVAPTEQSGVVTVPGATKANPIVGRIAFWTDDETSKLNINTASHGYYWDIPRVFSVEDRDYMAMRQPTLREFQRYPGHPATTSLWPVLRHLYSSDDEFRSSVFGAPGEGGNIGISPRVVGGGSEGGTVKATEPISMVNPPPRLYATVEELLFQPGRSTQTGLTRQAVEAAKFFLTAHSQAPEVSLFNLPRMAIWPINAGSKTTSSLDELIKFCSTISGIPYYLVRENSWSGTSDMALLDKQNEKLHKYLTTQMERPVPGYGDTSFKQKYASGETEQIATQILDYVRSSNLYSTALGAAPYTGTGAANEVASLGSGVGQVTPLKIGNTKGFGRLPILSKAILQLYICGVQTSKETWIGATGATPVFGNPSAELNANGGATGSAEDLARVLREAGPGEKAQLLAKAIVYFDTFDPNYGYTYPRYNFDVRVTFSNADWKIDGGTSMNLPTGASTIQVRRDHAAVWNNRSPAGFREIWMGRFLGGLLGPHWMIGNYNTVGGSGYPLVSTAPFIVSTVDIVDANSGSGGPSRPTLPASTLPNGISIGFSGGTATAELIVKDPVTNAEEVVQTYTFAFPAVTNRPAPTIIPRNMVGPWGAHEDESVLRQLAVSADFKNRLHAQPMDYYPVMGANTNPNLGIIAPWDTVYSLEPAWGDKRLIAAKSVLTTGASAASGASFVPHKDNGTAGVHVAADLRTDPYGVEKKYLAGLFTRRAGRILDITYGQNAMPDIPTRYDKGVETDGGFPADFDNGTLHMPDDAYVNRPDEGSATDQTSGTGSQAARNFAWYWDRPNYTAAGSGAGAGVNNMTFYSPNKQIPSAVMFGSLPTGVVANKQWQTLLFRPDPGGHPGARSGFPADHLLLDLFWMPVVEPYAISEPFATSGKVNMNYQILPYSYIHRSTGMRGVLQSQKLISISNSQARAANATEDPITGYATGTSAKGNDNYKIFSEGAMTVGASISGDNFRKALNLDEARGTLRSFEDRFARGEVFRSETEICNVPLIPEDAEYAADFETSYWGSRRLTGDNSREMPYAHLLPRLTTRSNTYTVYYRVQSLKKVASTGAGVWDEGRDRVVAEQRGSRTIERYIDPSNSRIPNYLDAAASGSGFWGLDRLDKFYRWRTLNNRVFAP